MWLCFKQGSAFKTHDLQQCAMQFITKISILLQG